MASLDGASSDPAAEWSMSCFGQQGPEWDLLTCKGYRWVRMLGRGQYGTAHLVEKGGEQVVAKVVVLDQLKDRDRALALQEVEVLSRLHHPNIVSHIASWLHKGVPGLPGQEALVNVMEFCAGGDLRAWLEACAASGEQLSQLPDAALPATPAGPPGNSPSMAPLSPVSVASSRSRSPCSDASIFDDWQMRWRTIEPDSDEEYEASKRLAQEVQVQAHPTASELELERLLQEVSRLPPCPASPPASPVASPKPNLLPRRLRPALGRRTKIAKIAKRKAADIDDRLWPLWPPLKHLVESRAPCPPAKREEASQQEVSEQRPRTEQYARGEAAGGLAKADPSDIQKASSSWHWLCSQQVDEQGTQGLAKIDPYELLEDAKVEMAEEKGEEEEEEDDLLREHLWSALTPYPPEAAAAGA